MPLDHPKLLEHRNKVKEIIDSERINRRLLLNYDLVYRVRYRGRQSNLSKRRKDLGKTADLLPPVKRRYISEVNPRPVISEEDRRQAKRRGQRTHVDDETCQPNVAEGRIPHTTCTSIWADGTYGPLLMVLPPGMVSQPRINAINEKYGGVAPAPARPHTHS